ncbi:DUF4350 domain-containing protein [Actinospica sp.]|jgi:hypothetical protein|uniref:DUF4350 domain-containing protein n=1 Tax=Actinospica sp. TaxID=1872142 RepID=UPI002C00B98B|nr:DUF4350 domain-containing protein [Actinospica sp.]HWG23242.1 DUF4350 domain-containing protein [Actinospica sp.]
MTRLRHVLLVAAAALLTTLTPSAYAASPSTTTTPLVSPENDDGMLNMLMENGIQYTTSTAADDATAYSGSDTTLVIDQDEANMSASDIAQLASSTWGRVIILSYDPNLISAFAPGVATDVPTSTSASTVVDPGTGCAQSDSTAAGSVVMPAGAETYDLSAATASPTATPTSTASPAYTDLTGCYVVGSRNNPALVSLHNTKTGGDVILLGWTDFTENEYLTSQGDAALALGLFGGHGTLVWLATQFTEDYNLNGCLGQACGSGNPSGTATGNPSGGGGGSGGGNGNGGGGGGSSQAVTLAQLIPHWIWWMLLQLLVAAAALAYWRSRRLGRLVGEKLPVKVRAAETVEGHANLYRRASAHGRAAGLLRSAAARRIAPLLGLPAGPAGRNPESLVQAVAERLRQSPGQVHAILAGEVPMTESELVRLTDQLDRLEQEVRSS